VELHAAALGLIWATNTNTIEAALDVLQDDERQSVPPGRRTTGASAVAGAGAITVLLRAGEAGRRA